jgi:rhamnose transport system permease protein
MKQITKLLGSWEALLVVLLVLSIVLGSILSPTFLSGFNFSIMVTDFMEIAIMALPMTLIIIVGDIDLSVASILGLTGAVLGLAWNGGLPLWVGICMALLVGIVAGLVNGLLITLLGLPSLVVTLGTLALYRGLAYVLLQTLTVSNFPMAFINFGFGTVPGTLIPWPFVVFVLLAIVFMVVLHRSWIGRQLYAIGSNQEAAKYAGIRVGRVRLVLFVVSGLLAALAGIIFTARFASARADNAVGFELTVITAVLLGGVDIFGGRGTLVGVVLSLFIIGILRNAMSLAYISTEIQTIVIGSLLILSVLGPHLVERIQVAIARRRLAGVAAEGSAGSAGT